MDHVEPLTGGLVQTKFVDQLDPGELSDGAGLMYISNKDSLVTAPDLTAGSTLEAAAFSFGIVGATFDNGNCYVINGTQIKYRYATVNNDTGALGSFTDIVTYNSDNARRSLSSAQYNNKYYLFDGIQRNTVIRSDASYRPHGMLPVITALPGITTASAATNVFPAVATGWFDYWYTEVFKSSSSVEDIVMESSYEATTTDSNLANAATGSINVSGPNGEAAKMLVSTVLIAQLNTTATITIPINLRNSTATHIRLYRSQAKDSSTDSSFPNGELRGEFAIPRSAANTHADDQVITVTEGAVTTSGYMYPSAVSSGTGWSGTAANAVDGSGHYADATFTTKVASLGTGASTGDNIVTLAVKTFNAPATLTAEPISQLEVSVRGKAVTVSGSPAINSASVRAQVSFDAGASWSGWVSMGKFTSTAAEVTTGFQTWGRASITTEDVLDANLIVRLDFTVSSNQSAPRSVTISVDGVRLRGIYGATGGVAPSPYPGIVLNQGKINFVTSRNGQPPIAKTGCVFQGSLVTDDSANASNIRWSIPGDPEAFPTLYYLPIETSNNDKITFIGTVNNVCVVGLQNAIARLNYLPSEDDASFNRTKIYDFISTNLGILSCKAAVTFLTPDGKELLAMATQDGIYVTDGFSMSKWDSDLDYLLNVIQGVASLSGGSIYDPRWIQLVNDTSSGNLLLCYVTSVGNAKIYMMNYSPRHLKSGPRFKISPPQLSDTATEGIATLCLRTPSGIPVLYFIKNIASSGASKILTVPSVGLLAFTGKAGFVQTRTIQFAKGLNDAVIQYVILHTTGIGISTISVAATTTSLGDASGTTSSTFTLDGTTQTIAKADLQFTARNTYFIVTTNGTSHRVLNRLAINFTDFGSGEDKD